MVTLPASLDQLKISKPKRNIGCQQLLEEGHATHSGSLRKEPENRGKRLLGELVRLKWPTKFVVISEGCLYIFDTETSDQFESASSLFGYDKVECDIAAPGSLQWTFKVTNELSDRKKVLHFQASSEDDRRLWVDTLKNEIWKVYSPILPGVTRPKILPPDGILSTMSPQDRQKVRATVTDDLEYVDISGLERQQPDAEAADEDYDDIIVSPSAQQVQNKRGEVANLMAKPGPSTVPRLPVKLTPGLPAPDPTSPDTRRGPVPPVPTDEPKPQPRKMSDPSNINRTPAAEVNKKVPQPPSDKPTPGPRAKPTPQPPKTSIGESQPPPTTMKVTPTPPPTSTKPVLTSENVVV